jgi:hypothetical protein
VTMCMFPDVKSIDHFPLDTVFYRSLIHLNKDRPWTKELKQ